MSENLYHRTESPPINPAVTAQGSMWAGIVALMCFVVMPCTCYVSLFAGIPLAIMGSLFGFQALQNPDPPPNTRPMAIAGLVASTFSLLWGLAILTFLGLYVAFVVIMVAAGA